MKSIKNCSRIFVVLLLVGCATSANIQETDYSGIYQSSKNPLNRIIVDFEDGLYKVQFHAGEAEWEGVGYESGSKIVAVIRSTLNEENAEFLNISFPGNDQLFLVARNPQGGYIRDEYFTKAN